MPSNLQSEWIESYGNEINKTRLIKKFKAGNLSDTELVYILSQVTRYIRRCHTSLSSEADDIASEAVLIGWDKINSFQGEENFFSWLKGIARNLVLKHLQQTNKLQTYSRDAALGYANDESPEEVEAFQEQAGLGDNDWLRSKALEDARASLSEEQQTIVTLRIDQQYASKEVAKMLDLTDSNVRTKESRACSQMYKFLMENGYSDIFPKKQPPKKRLSNAASVTALTSLSAGL